MGTKPIALRPVASMQTNAQGAQICCFFGIRIIEKMNVPKIRIWRRRIKRIKLLFQVRIQRPRIVLGSGGIGVPGWIMTDIDQLDILSEEDWATYFRPAFAEAILAEHVWEHLTIDEGTRAAKLCWKYLRPGGRLRVAVPDGLHPDRT